MKFMTIDPRHTLAEAERTLIGQVMLDARVLDEVSTTAAEFLDPKGQIAWRTAQELHSAGTAPTPLTIADAAPAGFDLLSWLTECSLATLTSANAAHHAEIIRKESLRRRIVLVASMVLSEAQAGDLDGDELHSMLLAEATGIDPGHTDDTAMSMAMLVRERFEAYGEMAERREAGDVTVTGIPTGLEKLDEVIGGIQQGVVTVVAGMSSMGKSSVALGFAAHAASIGLGVHVFTMEDTSAVYADRMVARISGVPVTSIRSGKLSRGDMDGMLTASRVLAARRCWMVDDSASLSPDEVCRRVRRRTDGVKTRLVVVDYIQLMRHPKAARHDLQLAASMNVFAALAKKDDLAVVVLSQLNRGNKERRDKRPQEQDLRGAGEIGEASKCVIGVYRGAHLGDPIKGIDYEQERPSDHEWQQRIDLHVLKNSNGKTGNVRCRWSGETTRVY